MGGGGGGARAAAITLIMLSVKAKASTIASGVKKSGCSVGRWNYRSHLSLGFYAVRAKLFHQAFHFLFHSIRGLCGSNNSQQAARYVRWQSDLMFLHASCFVNAQLSAGVVHAQYACKCAYYERTLLSDLIGSKSLPCRPIPHLGDPWSARILVEVCACFLQPFGVLERVHGLNVALGRWAHGGQHGGMRPTR